MSCDHCVTAVRKELAGVPGVAVQEVRVGSARISYDSATIPFERIDAAIRKAGFTVAQ
jgi:copper chaperone CopZ